MKREQEKITRKTEQVDQKRAVLTLGPPVSLSHTPWQSQN